VNLARPDPAVIERLPNVARDPVEGVIRAVVSTAMGFGGMNAALAFARPT
jgi:3-oxoacyl-(acyl-carrier-protein) synthase